MPTSSVYGFLTLTNLGPVTTVYTPPPACSTIPPDPGVARSIDDDDLGGYDIFCGVPYRQECFPSGKARATIFKDRMREYHQVLPYYSPAPACPSGWTTIGTQAPKTNGSGIFTTTYSPGVRNGLAQLVDDVLAPDETMVACCPR